MLLQRQERAESANYPFCTIEPNVGVVAVPDHRLDELAKMYNPEKYTPAVIKFVDIAGLVKGASKGEGLGNKFLSNIREVDAVVHVVRCFDDPDVIHVDGNADPERDIGVINLELVLSDMEVMEKRIDRTNADPERDIGVINLELVLSDMEVMEKRIDRTKKMMKGGDKSYQAALDVYEKIYAALEAEKPARSVELDADEMEFTRDLQLITLKPVLYCCNIKEDDIGNSDIPYVNTVKKIAEAEGSQGFL